MTLHFRRRQILKAALTSVVMLPVAACTSILNARRGKVSTRTAAAESPYRFFQPDEAAFIDAAVARLIPADELGPGALEAGATHFIDGQLAGGFGAAKDWYMQGPWQTGLPQQGYQSRLTPAGVYRAGIEAVNTHCQQQFAGKRFNELSPPQQDEVLKKLEAGQLNLASAPGKTFFKLLHDNTIQGFFADPIYGGNRDMVGWKLIGFPGARGDYLDYVERYDQPYPYSPLSLLGDGRPSASESTAKG